MDKLDYTIRKENGVEYKIIYRQTEEGSRNLLAEVGKFVRREWDNNFNMYANYFLLSN